MENKQQPVVNICGSCILRDTFYYQGVYGKEKDGGYRINRYVNFFSPLALEQPPIPIYDRAAYEAFDLKPFGLTNFFRRCRRLDCERSFIAGRYGHVSVSALSDAGKRAEVNLPWRTSSCIGSNGKTGHSSEVRCRSIFV